MQGVSGAASGTALPKARYSSRVTSNRPRATSAPGRTTISGQTSQSLKTLVCAAGGGCREQRRALHREGGEG